MTIVRPYLIQSVFTIEQAGDVNARIARYQQLARAAGPVAMALLASRFSYATILAALAVSFVMVTLVAPAVLAKHGFREGDAMKTGSSQTDAAAGAEPACCEATTLQTCCGTEAKAGCCGAETAPKVCGCSASQNGGSAVNA